MIISIRFCEFFYDSIERVSECVMILINLRPSSARASTLIII